MSVPRPGVAPETRFPLPALDLVIEHLLSSPVAPASSANETPPTRTSAPTLPSPSQSTFGPLSVTTQFSVGMVPSPPSPPTNICSSPTCHCKHRSYASKDMVNLSLVCRYFRDVIWRNRLRILKISADEDFKKLEKNVTSEYRGAVK